MKRFGKRSMCLLLAIGFMLSIPFSVYAAESPAVVGLNIDEDGAGLFLYGDLPQGLAAKVSGQDCEVEVVGLAESESDIRTLLLIDISTSMRQGSQKQVIDALTALIDSKGENEQYAIAAFGVEYNLLVDFTSDRYDLIKAVEQLAWDGQGSSIYRAVDAATDTADKDQQNDGTFTQVVLFSDGVEKAEDGIIKEELFFSLKEAPLPVHTIGFQYENNAEGLKELYAISRMTGGFSFGLTAGTSSSEAISQVAQYIAEVNCVDIRLPEQVKDGAVRPLELLDGSGGQILMYDLHMPVSAQPSSAPESTPPPSAAPAPAPEPTQEPEPTAQPALNTPMIALVGVGIILVAAIIVFIVKRKALKPDEESGGTGLTDQTEFVGADGDATMFLIADAGRRSGSGQYLILNDLAQPHKRFEVLVESKVEVGRNPNPPGITIDYDKRMSRQHFAIVKRDGSLWIEDLGSANKTYVNDELITSPKVIRDDDVISCGKTKLSVKIERR